MASIGTVSIEVDANTAKLIKGVNASRKQISKLQKTATDAKKSIANFAKAAASIYAVAKAFDLASSAAGSFLNTAAEFEQYEATLKSITGSSEKARESMAWVQDFAARTPFAIQKVTQAFVKMKAYGLDPTDGTLKTLGDTAAAMGKDINQAVEAMADAVTGESERLKEFGIKASKDGEKIAYAWSDSSGKARNIVIDNNKDIIQSTLNAIFNEKYIGAMEEQSNTWNGMMNNLGDSWTNFQKEFMDAGLFDYIKSLAKVVSEWLNAGFKDAQNGAKSFSDTFIDYINTAIKAIGFLKDAITGIKMVAAAVGYAVMFMANAVTQAINLPVTALNALIETANDITGKNWTPIKPFIDNTWITTAQADLKNTIEESVDELINNSGLTLANKIIKDTKAGVAGVVTEVNKLAALKNKAKDTLIAIGAGFGTKDTKAKADAKKAAKEAAKAAKKAADEAAKATKKAIEQAQDLGDAYKSAGQDFANSFASGDMVGAFNSLSNGFLTSLDDMETGFKGFSAMLDGITLSSVWGALLWAGSQLFSSFMQAEAETPPILSDSLKVSESISNSLDDIANVQNPMLALTRDMRNYLETISYAFGNVENSLLQSGVDLGGNLVESTYNSGTLFGGKSTELYGATLGVDAASMGELMQGDLNAWLDTVIQQTKTTWYGKDKTSYIHNVKDISGSISNFIGDATTALFQSLTLSGDALGISTSGLVNEVIDLGKFETTGMSAADISAELEGRFGASMDAITQEYFGAVQEFQRGGEGLSQTLFRVITNFDQVGFSLGLLDKSVTWRTANIIEAVAGGIDALNNAISSYTANFFSDTEQYTMQLKTMQANFASLGLAMPATNDEFRSLLESFDTTTDAGAMLFAEMITLADGFNDMTTAAEYLAEEQQAIIDEQIALAEEAAAELLRIEEEMYNNKVTAAQKELTFSEGILAKIESAYSGSLTYLNSLQLSGYLGNLAQQKLIAGDTTGYADTLYSQLEAKKATSVTKEAYIPEFEKYILALGNLEPEEDPVVQTLQDILDQNARIEEAIVQSSYQASLVPIDVRVV